MKVVLPVMSPGKMVVDEISAVSHGAPSREEAMELEVTVPVAGKVPVVAVKVSTAVDREKVRHSVRCTEMREVTGSAVPAVVPSASRVKKSVNSPAVLSAVISRARQTIASCSRFPVNGVPFAWTTVRVSGIQAWETTVEVPVLVV